MFIDVKIAKNALHLMGTASAAHPYTLPDTEAPLPYKGKHSISVEFPISDVSIID